MSTDPRLVRATREAVLTIFSDGDFDQQDAPYPVTPEEARDMLADAVPNGYNRFRAELFDRFPSDCLVIIGRRGSPIIRVIPGKEPLPSRKQVDADSCIDADGEVEYFWE